MQIYSRKLLPIINITHTLVTPHWTASKKHFKCKGLRLLITFSKLANNNLHTHIHSFIINHYFEHLLLKNKNIFWIGMFFVFDIYLWFWNILRFRGARTALVAELTKYSSGAAILAEDVSVPGGPHFSISPSMKLGEKNSWGDFVHTSLFWCGPLWCIRRIAHQGLITEAE